MLSGLATLTPQAITYMWNLIKKEMIGAGYTDTKDVLPSSRQKPFNNHQ